MELIAWADVMVLNISVFSYSKLTQILGLTQWLMNRQMPGQKDKWMARKLDSILITHA